MGGQTLKTSHDEEILSLVFNDKMGILQTTS